MTWFTLSKTCYRLSDLNQIICIILTVDVCFLELFLHFYYKKLNELMFYILLFVWNLFYYCAFGWISSFIQYDLLYLEIKKKSQQIIFFVFDWIAVQRSIVGIQIKFVKIGDSSTQTCFNLYFSCCISLHILFVYFIFVGFGWSLQFQTI